MSRLRMGVAPLAAALLAAACGGAGVQRAELAPDPDSVPVPLASVPLLVETVDDSAADEATLTALDELEFGSLDRRAAHVRGVIPGLADSVPRLVEESARTLTTPRGGAAAVTGPAYDIDVASFADNARVQFYVDFFLDEARDRFTIWLGRLERYEGMVRARFRRQGIPEDLVYLGLIESGFSNTAVSRAHAVGMWQFIRSTGRRYGLQAGTWVDDRRDPFKATDAAARHLADLNQEFGSWYLAAAAYNGGAGRVSRGIRRLGNRADSLTDETFFALSSRRYLRRETRDYVPKLIAAAIIAKDPARYGFDSIPALRPFEYDEISVSSATGLDVLAHLADTTAATLKELNPQFFRGATPPDREVIVRVPRGSGLLVARRWAELPESERLNFIEHVVRRGETVSLIAKRYRVSTKLVLAANPSVRPRRLRVGHCLTVPISSAARSGAILRPTPSLTRSAPIQAQGTGGRGGRLSYHLVRWGDTLYLIGKRYGVTVADLTRWNEIRSTDILRVGIRLRISP